MEVNHEKKRDGRLKILFCAGLMGCFIFVMATTGFAQKGMDIFGFSYSSMVNVWEALFVNPSSVL